MTWSHDLRDQPTEMYSECDEDGWVHRMVDEFADGRLGWADRTRDDKRTGTFVTDRRLDSAEQLNEVPEFNARDISAAEFEEVWDRARRASEPSPVGDVPAHQGSRPRRSVDLMGETTSPLDVGLVSYVLQIAGWLDSSTDEELDEKVAVDWLELLKATVAATDDAGRERFREIAEQLAVEADANGTLGGGEAIRRAASLLLDSD